MPHQVKKLALKTFLLRQWSNESLANFGTSFVLDIVMQLLAEPFFHNDADFDYEVLNAHVQHFISTCDSHYFLTGCDLLVLFAPSQFMDFDPLFCIHSALCRALLHLIQTTTCVLCISGTHGVISSSIHLCSKPKTAERLNSSHVEEAF